MHAKSLQLCLTLCNLWTIACQAPLSMGILQARELEWVGMSSSRGSSRLKGRTHFSYLCCLGRRVLYH